MSRDFETPEDLQEYIDSVVDRADLDRKYGSDRLNLNCRSVQRRLAYQQGRPVPTFEFRRYLCGTRKTVKKAWDDFRVVCASCDAGGAVRHQTHDSAMTAATRDSVRPCGACGAA